MNIVSYLYILAIPEDSLSELEPREQNPDVRINRKSMIGRSALLSIYVVLTAYYTPYITVDNQHVLINQPLMLSDSV